MGDEAGKVQQLYLLDLPNEILLQSLYSMPTLPLLKLRIINHRFRNLIERLVHKRLQIAASLGDWKLIIECYHPSQQYSEPYFFCDYLGTEGLARTADPGPGISGDGGFRSLVSKFVPTRKTPERRFSRSPASERVNELGVTGSSNATQSSAEDFVKRTINLDEHEPFTQIIFHTSLVQLGPRRGVFLALADVLERKTMRIFRTWLADSAVRPRNGSEPSEMLGSSDKVQTLSIDEKHGSAQLQVSVRELRSRRPMPVLVSANEDQPVSYTLELRELRISILHLLLAMERKLLESQNESGRAMIFGSFPTATSPTEADEQES